MSRFCRNCTALVEISKNRSEGDVNNLGSSPTTCSICLGIWTDEFSKGLENAMKQAMESYGGPGENVFSRRLSTPNVILPGDISYRYKVFSRSGSPAVTAFCHDLKEHAKKILDQCLSKLDGPKDLLKRYPQCVRDEEQGYLAVHVVLMPAKDRVYRPDYIFSQRLDGKRRNRKRNFHIESQGGDPKGNLEHRLKNKNIIVWTINQALDSYKSDPDFLNTRQVPDKLVNEKLPADALDYHVAIWRRPFYIRGMYTKIRRDISQTPFFVVDNGKKRKLGSTSVEEEISPVITKYCGGIATNNNDPELTNVVYGMAKFHASGREDMDVRMLLPPDFVARDSTKLITGRPFVYEIIDSLRLLPVDSLASIVKEVNNFESNNNTPDKGSYGRNPRGVGISPCLQFVPSSSFKKLQSETEDKVKYYGCLCWSEEPLPSTDEELVEKLGSFPLEIQQMTPIRVLHRRSLMSRTRHVLSCKAHLIDNHYFRLHISTDAGTYVKEFVHSDLGRSEPSISSLLGCKTDILELDCEGIQI